MKDYPDKMSPEQARAFRDAVLNIVAQIPRGCVTTYGDIATLAGWPSHSRMVGRTLRYTPGAENLPCHRVVNKSGRTAPGWSRQRPTQRPCRNVSSSVDSYATEFIRGWLVYQ